MSIYSTKAFGIFLYDACVVSNKDALKGHVDFIVGHAGKGQTPALKFKEWAELAKYLDVPFIGYIESDPEICIGWTYNPSVWPSFDKDPHTVMAMRNAKYSSGVQVPIHGWIIDGSKYLQSDNKTFLTDNWIKGIWEYVIGTMFKRFRVPVYPYIKKETINRAPKDGALITYLSNQASVSTYEPVFKPEATGWGSQFLPSDLDGPLQPYANQWDFWYYGATKLPGCDTLIPMFLSHFDKANLYAELGFKPTGTVTPPSSGDNGDSGTGDNGTGDNGTGNNDSGTGNSGGTVNVDLTALVAELGKIATAMSQKKSYTITIKVQQD